MARDLDITRYEPDNPELQAKALATLERENALDLAPMLGLDRLPCRVCDNDAGHCCVHEPDECAQAH